MKLTIGEKIALLRKKRNVTQTELAEYLYLTPRPSPGGRWGAARRRSPFCPGSPPFSA